MMEQRRYGLSGKSLSVLGIGCWAYGGGDYWGPQDEKDVDWVVSKALDTGINYFDTAEAYNDGRSEEALGRALKGRRHQAVIGTKVLPVNTEPAILREHCEASLKRLNTDYVDIYMVHWPLTGQPVEPTFAAFAALKSEGKIRSIGVSNFGVHQLEEALSTGAQVEVNQLCYNLVSRAIEYELIPFCAAREIGILAYTPLAQGLLTGKFHSADEMPPVRTRTRHFRGDRPGARHGEAGAEDAVFKALDGIRQVAEELHVPVAQVSLAWCLSRAEITCVLPGIRTPAQLKENLAGVQIKLTPEVKSRLDQLTLALRDQLGASPDYYQARNNSRTW